MQIFSQLVWTMFETIYQFFYLKFLLKKIKNVDTLFHCWYFLLKTTYLATTTGHHIRPILGRYAQIIAFDSQLTMVPESFQVVFEFVFYKILFVIFKFSSFQTMKMNRSKKLWNENGYQSSTSKICWLHCAGAITNTTYLELHTCILLLWLIWIVMKGWKKKNLLPIFHILICDFKNKSQKEGEII